MSFTKRIQWLALFCLVLATIPGCTSTIYITAEQVDRMNPLLDENFSDENFVDKNFAEKNRCDPLQRMCYLCNCSKFPKKFSKKN